MNIKATIDGEELEFEAIGYQTGQADYLGTTHLVNKEGVVEAVEGGTVSAKLRLRLIRKQHTFGVITLEETGERGDRFNRGDWYLDSAGLPAPVGCLTKLTSEYPILHPVALEDDDHRN